MPNLMESQFENPIAKIDIATGRGFCKIFEVWDRDASYRSPWVNYRENMAEEAGSAEATAVVATLVIDTPVEGEKPPSGAKKKQKRGGRASRDLSGLFGVRRIG